MARFSETVNIQQAPDLGPVDTSLGDRLTSFSQQLQSIQAQKVQQRSLAEGRAAFKQGEDPEFKEEKFFGSIGSKAYNQGLRASYIASVDRDNREEVARIAAENPTNLAGYNDAVESYKNATLTNIDPSARQIVSDSMESLISANRIRVQTQEIKATHEANDTETADHVESAVSDALRFAGDGDDISSAESMLAAFQSIDGRVAAEFMSSEEAVIQKREINKDATQEKLKGGLFRTFDAEGAQASFNDLDDLSDKTPKGFSPDEWESFISDTQTDLNRKVARQERFAKGQAKLTALNNSVSRGLLFFNPNIPADPVKSGQDAKDVNNYYDNEYAPKMAAEAQSVEALIDANVLFVKNTGLVPNALASKMNGSMRSGNPENVAVMMEVMQRVQENSPQSLRDILPDTKAVALQVSESMRNGLDSETAIEIARKNTYGLNEGQKKEIKAAVGGKSKQKLLDRFEDTVKDKFDTAPFFKFNNVPDTPIGMQSAYVANFEDFMIKTDSNVEQSELLAMESLQNKWAISDVGGTRRWMEDAPESHYHIDGIDDAWLEDQFLEDAELLEIPDAIIGVDNNTPRSDKPSYPIMAPNANGILDIVEDPETGQPQRWQPDFTQTEAYKELIGAPGVAVESSKKKRKQKLEKRANSIRRRMLARIFANDRNDIPKDQRDEFLATDEGRVMVSNAVNIMLAINKIDQVEAKQVLDAFEAGALEDLPVFGVLNANNQ